MRYPTDNPYISSGYGWRTGIYGEKNFHHGVDFPRPYGGNLYAIQKGRVLSNEWREFGGWTVSIQFENGVVGWYQHMKNRPHLRVDSQVSEGDVIGIMGDTGKYVQGVHVHFELRKNGISFDPEPYLRVGTAASGGGGSKPLPLPVPETKEIEMRTIYNKGGVDAPDSDVAKRRRALVGEFTFQRLGVEAARQEYMLWGPPENVTDTEFRNIEARVIARRKAAGLD